MALAITTSSLIIFNQTNLVQTGKSLNYVDGAGEERKDEVADEAGHAIGDPLQLLRPAEASAQFETGQMLETGHATRRDPGNVDGASRGHEQATVVVTPSQARYRRLSENKRRTESIAMVRFGREEVANGDGRTWV